jgi:TPR repeat protein
MTKKGLFIFMLFWMTLLVSSPILADYQTGLDAYHHGDYETALKEWRPLAEQGNAKAQVSLGIMYSQGQGVPQDYVQSAKWVRLAAEQGDASAQFNLGRMYFEGLGVPHDFVLALMWTNLAAAQGNEAAIEVRNVLRERLGDDKIAEAQRLAREWKVKGK